MEPVFTINLGERIEPGLVTLGVYDGVHPMLTCATPSGKIILHAPHDTAHPIRTLNLQKKITGLLAGPLEGGHDVLYVGSPTDLLAYDVENNKDLYHKELPDGVSAMAAGKFGESQSDLVFAGGNCSIQGFDAKGADRFWTVIGDHVSSLALCDLVGDGNNQLLAASEDFDMRVYLEGNELLHEFPETEQVTGMCNLGGSRFGYCLGNGSIGTYDGPEKSWRVKMKSKPLCIMDFDMTMDGIPELVTGWSDGTVDVRKDRANGSGEILIRDKFPCAIAGLVQGDYRNDGTNMILAVSVEGEVRGYLPLGVARGGPPPPPDAEETIPRTKATRARAGKAAANDTRLRKRRNSNDIDGAMTAKDETVKAVVQEEAWLRELEDLQAIKRDLVLDLKLLGQREAALELPPALDNAFLLTPDISCDFAHADQGEGIVNLNIALGIDACLVSVILQADGLFDDGHRVVFGDGTSRLTVPIPTKKNAAVPMTARCVVGTKGQQASAVHDLQLTLPVFAAMTPRSIAEAPLDSTSFVRLPVRFNSVEMEIERWLDDSFLTPSPAVSQDGILALVLTRGNIPVEIDFFADNANEIHIKTANLEVATDLVQSMLSTLGLTDTQSEVVFPLEMTALRALLAKVDGLNAARQRLSADIAEKSELAKGLLFQAEDRRELQEFAGMQESYQNLFNLNRDLLASYSMRCSNQTELVQSVKAINLYIQRAARLRARPVQASIIKGCREAFKANDIPRLISIIRTGRPGKTAIV